MRGLQPSLRTTLPQWPDTVVEEAEQYYRVAPTCISMLQADTDGMTRRFRDAIQLLRELGMERPKSESGCFRSFCRCEKVL